MANANAILSAARKAKQDEFYTQWADIEREMNAYLEYDADVFRGKTVLLPCDDPEWSNFTKFFALHFVHLGLKKLISTSYAPESNAQGAFYAPTLFEVENPAYDVDISRVKGRLFTLLPEDVSGDGRVDIDDLRWEYLEGDGDFRSAEVTRLRDEADIIITNPPFSLFREYAIWLIAGGMRFAMIGHQNSITYKEIFLLIQADRMWLGRGFPRNMAHFRTPYKVHSQWVEQEGEGIVRVPGIQWFTNIEHGRRHEPLQLMTMADNIKFSRHKEVRGTGYQQYDNYDAIEVPYTDAIPSDHDGAMGVPITFLNKYNPDQFEILGSYNNGVHGAELGAEKVEILVNGKPSMWNGPVVDGEPLYKRIVIRHRNPGPEES